MTEAPMTTAEHYLVLLAESRGRLAAQERAYVWAAHRRDTPPDRIAEAADTSVERIRAILAEPEP